MKRSIKIARLGGIEVQPDLTFHHPSLDRAQLQRASNYLTIV
jgi:hypothetical protein